MKYCSLLLIILIIYLTYDYCNINEPFVSTEYDTTRDRLITVDNENTDSMFSFSLGSSCPDNVGNTAVANFDGNLENCDYKKTDCQVVADTYDFMDWNYGSDSDSKRKECQKCVRGSEKMSGTVSILSNAYEIGEAAPKGKDQYSLYTDFSGYICDAMVGCGDSDTMYAFNNTDWSTDCGGGFDTSDNMSIINSLRCTMIDNFLIRTIASYLGGMTCSLEIQGIQAINAVKGAFDATINDMECAMPGNFGENCGD